MKTLLTQHDYYRFFVSVIYNNIDDTLEASIRAAYRDVCRTISGFSKNINHDVILENVKKLLYKEVNLMLNNNIKNQEDFDNWHKEFCDKLIKEFKNQTFTYGQAQKWINMTLKNLSMLEHKKVRNIYQFFHVPIDNYILKGANYNLRVPWSRLSNYDEYLEFQKYFRAKYNEIPLDKEFNMWLEQTRNM